MKLEFISIESVLYAIKKNDGVPFLLQYFSKRSKCRKTKSFLYRNVGDLPSEGTISLTLLDTGTLATIKISHMIQFNNQLIKH